jgi:hypothetical protein
MSASAIRIGIVVFPLAAILLPMLRCWAVRREWLERRTGWRPREGWARATTEDVLAGRAPAFPAENKALVVVASLAFMLVLGALFKQATPGALDRITLIAAGIEGVALGAMYGMSWRPFPPPVMRVQSPMLQAAEAAARLTPGVYLGAGACAMAANAWLMFGRAAA